MRKNLRDDRRQGRQVGGVGISGPVTDWGFIPATVRVGDESGRPFEPHFLRSRQEVSVVVRPPPARIRFSPGPVQQMRRFVEHGLQDVVSALSHGVRTDDEARHDLAVSVPPFLQMLTRWRRRDDGHPHRG
ncbi:hypothetical protein SPW_7323 [Streptomyces sp. W007]|nr:hypothetical protein SPW_7323 [Streptomyces sp. W007]